MVVRPTEGQVTETGQECLVTPSRETSKLATAAGEPRSEVVGVVSVELLPDDRSGSFERTAPNARLQVTEANGLLSDLPDQLVDLGRNLRGDLRVEPPLSLACARAARIASSSWSAQRSQSFRYASNLSRSRRPSATCRRATSASSWLKKRV